MSLAAARDVASEVSVFCAPRIVLSVSAKAEAAGALRPLLSLSAAVAESTTSAHEEDDD